MNSHDHDQPFTINGITLCAAGLAADVTRATHTLADVNDYAFADMPEGTRTIEIYCASPVLWALGDSSITYGRRIEAGLVGRLVLDDAAIAAVAAGLALHVSGTSGTVVEVSYLKQ